MFGIIVVDFNFNVLAKSGNYDTHSVSFKKFLPQNAGAGSEWEMESESGIRPKSRFTQWLVFVGGLENAIDRYGIHLLMVQHVSLT